MLGKDEKYIFSREEVRCEDVHLICLAQNMGQ